MDKITTRYFLYFIICFFVLGFIGTAIYQNILGNSKSYVLNKAKKRFYNNQYNWKQLFNLCSEINGNNKSKNIEIMYFLNQQRIDCSNETVKDSKGEIIRDLNVAYPHLRMLMQTLDISDAIIQDSLYTFSLRRIPGSTCLIINSLLNEDTSALPKNRKWEDKLEDNIYVVQMR